MCCNNYKINGLAFFVLCSQIFFSCRTQHPVNPGFGGAFQTITQVKPSGAAANRQEATDSVTQISSPVAVKKPTEIHPAKQAHAGAMVSGSKLKSKANAVLQKLKPNRTIKSQWQNAKSGGSGGGGGMALIAVGLLLFLLLRKVIGLSAGWSWGIVILIVFIILMFIVAS